MGKKNTLKDRLERAMNLFSLASRDPNGLSEQLYTDSFALNVIQDGLLAYMEQQKSEIPTDPELFEPKVTATVASSHVNLEDIDITVWFILASDEDLCNLREEEYGEGSIAESIAEFIVLFDSNVETLFLNASQVSCLVNRHEAEMWIEKHRPHLSENYA